MTETLTLDAKNASELIAHIVMNDLNLDYDFSETAESLRGKIGRLYTLRDQADRNGLVYTQFDSPDELAQALLRERARAVEMARGLGVEVLSRDTIEGITEKIALKMARHYASELDLVWDPEESADTVMDRIEGFKEDLARQYPSLADWLPSTFSLAEINQRIAAL